MLIVTGNKQKRQDLEVKCSLCSRVFFRRKDILSGSKTCPYCEGTKIFDVDHFKERVNKISAGKYDLSLVTEYPGYYGKVIVFCNECNSYEEKSVSSLLNGRSGCKSKHYDKVWISRSKEMYDKLILEFDSEVLEILEYDENTQKAKTKCLLCGNIEYRWLESGSISQKCKKCYTQRKTTECFINESKELFGDHYSYDLCEYQTAKTPVKLFCNHCKKYFYSIPNNHLMGCGGCPTCPGLGYSDISVRIMNKLSELSGFFIAHAQNIGEKKIKSEKGWYKADGFIQELNLVIEYNGDKFHGNPAVFSSTAKCNPYDDVSAGELYEGTKLKERVIKSQGFNYLTIWEHDYKTNTQETIQKCLNYINELKNNLGKKEENNENI
jgi:hypothetical protein